MPDFLRSASLTNYAELARSVGLDPDRMLDAVGLDAKAAHHPDSRIRAGAFRRLLEASAQASGVEDFGLRLAETRDLSILGPIGLVLREEPTVRKAVEALIVYGRLHNESLDLHLDETQGVAILTQVIKARRSVPMRQSVELSLAVLYRLLRIFAGPAWRPRICFMGAAPRQQEAYWRVFRSPVEFGCDFNGIICSSRDLDRAIPTSNPEMARQARQYLDSLLARPGASFRDKVRELVSVQLALGDFSIETVAQQIGVDRRTVHRRLARHGTTYSALLDEVRRDMAPRYLDNDDRPVAAVAELLGFSAQSAFARWFSASFGCTASGWRAGRNVRRPTASTVTR